MPKIIELDAPSAVVGRFKCTGAGNGNAGCKSLIEVYREDLYKTYSTSYCESADEHITFECPNCKAETDIPVRGIPSSTILTKSEYLKKKKI